MLAWRASERGSKYLLWEPLWHNRDKRAENLRSHPPVRKSLDVRFQGAYHSKVRISGVQAQPGAKSTLHSLLRTLSGTAITTLHAFLYCT